MKLFFFRSGGWGHVYAIARAADEAEAKALLDDGEYRECAHELDADGWQEVSASGTAALLFDDSYSPDTGE